MEGDFQQIGIIQMSPVSGNGGHQLSISARLCYFQLVPSIGIVIFGVVVMGPLDYALTTSI
jgi:hypothetical protein